MKLRIYYSECESPCEDDFQWKLYSFNRHHINFKHPDNFLRPTVHGPVGVNIGFQRKLDVGTAFIVSCYEHGSSHWGLQGEVTQCQWDTAKVAGVLVWENPVNELGPKTYEDRQKDARAFLEEYTNWCNGNCYGYVIEDDNGKVTDSCGGFIGDKWFKEALKTGHPELFKDGTDELKNEIELDGEAADVMK